MTEVYKLNPKDIRKWFPGVLISGIALFMVFRLANWKDLSSAFILVRPIFIIITACLSVLFLVARGFAWKVILQNQVSFADSFYTINIGYLLNNLFPLRAGEIGRAIFLGQKTGLGVAHILSSIVIERAFDLAIAAILLLSTLPLALGMAWAKPVATITLIIVLISLLTMYLAARNKEKVNSWIQKWGIRWSYAKIHLLPQLEALLNGMAVLTKPRQFIISFALVGLSWLFAVIEYYIMAVMIADNVPFWWGAFLDSILALGIAIPSAPAALGVFEASLVAGLALLKVPGSIALAFSISVHFTQFVVTGIIGFIGLNREKKSIINLFSEINNNNAR